MDAVSYSLASKQAQRIEKFIENPDSTSGIVTVPKTIATGETVTVPAGRVAVLPNIVVDGTLNIDGEVFIPSGSSVDFSNGIKIDGNNIALSIPTSYHLLEGNLSATINANYVEVSATTTRNYTTSDYIFDSLNNKLYDCISASTSGVLLTNTTYFTLITAGTLQINTALVPFANGIDSNGAKNTIIYKNETITGLTLTAGKNYVYAKNDGTYGVKSIAPSYGKDNPLIGDFYNVITNKWYSNTNVEITESRNYLNHIVYADANGQVAYVEKLPKIEYKDIIKANEYRGRNACTAKAIFDRTTYKLSGLYKIAGAININTQYTDFIFEEEMDNIDYEVSIDCSLSAFASNAMTPYSSNKTTRGFRVQHYNTAGGGSNPSMVSIIVLGGKN